MVVCLGCETRGPLVAVIVTAFALVVGESFHVAQHYLKRLLLEIAVHGCHCHAGLLGAAHFAVYKVLEVADKLLVALGYLHEVDVCIHVYGD